MIKEGFRESVGFEVFSVTATPSCATHNLAAPAGAGRPELGLIHSRDACRLSGAHALARKGRIAKIPAEATKGDSKFSSRHRSENHRLGWQLCSGELATCFVKA
jgi:hypothetical protein